MTKQNGDKKQRATPEREKTVNIILAVVIALVLWAYVIGQVNPTTTQVIKNVPVQLLNIPSLTSRELAVSGSGNYTVDVVVEGKRADLAEVEESELVAQADLFGWSAGTNEIPVTVEVPEKLELVEIRPTKIEVTIEPLVSVSKTVELVYNGTVAEDTEIGGIEVQPEQIQVTGAKSDVAKVDQIQVPISVADLSEEATSIQAAVTAVDTDGLSVSNVALSANYVDVNARICKLKQVKLSVAFVGTPGEGIGAETKVPEMIWIKGSKAAVKGIDAVSATDVNLTGMTSDSTVSLSVILPQDVELSERNQDLTAGINIVDVTSKTFSFSSEQIILEGLTKGKTINMDNSTIEVTVSATKEVMSDLTSADLSLSIDAKELKAGEQTVKLHAESEKSIQSVSITPDKITITVTTTEE